MKKLAILGFLSLIYSFTNAQTLNWIESWGTATSDYNQDLRIGPGDSIVVVGRIDKGIATIGSVNLDYSGAPSTNAEAATIVKFDENGTAVWGLVYNDESEIRTLELDASGNIYVIGQSPYQINLDPRVQDSVLTARNEDIFIAKYSPTGNLLWYQELSSFGNISDGDIAVGGGNVYITAELNDTVYTKFDADTITSPGPTNYSALFQIDATNGAVNWYEVFEDDDSDGSPQLRSLIVDGTDLYLLGTAYDTTDVEPGGNTTWINSDDQAGFMVKYNSSGTLMWANQIEPAPSDKGAFYSFALDAGRLYAVGFFDGINWTYGNHSGSVIVSGDTINSFLARVDASSGIVEKVSLIGGRNNLDIVDAFVANDSIWVFGAFETDFRGYADSNLVVLNGTNGEDPFIVNYDTAFNYGHSFRLIEDTGGYENEVGGARINSQGNLVFCGMFDTTGVDFQPGAGFQTTSGFLGREDAFVATVSFASPPPCPVDSAGPISGPTSLCAGDVVAYSIDTVRNADHALYAWTVGGFSGPTILSGQGSSSIVVEVSSDGPLTVEVTPSNGTCTGRAANLAGNVNNSPFAINDSIVTNPSCDSANGELFVYAQGGAIPYTYNWSSGDVGDTLKEIASGSFTVTVVDNNGCTIESTVQVNDDGAPEVTSSILTDLLCWRDESGEIAITVSGGAPPYSFSWSNGDTTKDISNLEAGGYRLIILDTVGCRYEEIFNLDEPSPLTGSISTSDVSTCGGNDGSATLSGGGGTGTITFLWNTGSTSNSSSSGTDTAGIYTVTVTDANGCTDSLSAAINESGAPTLSVDSILPQSCGNNDGEIHLTTNGATSPSYAWSNGTTSEDANSLAAGQYSVRMIDGSCTTYGVYIVENEKPESFPICMVTVDDTTTKNILVYEKPYTSGLGSFKFYRESWTDGVYQTAGSNHVDTNSVWVDMIAEPKLRSWRYQMGTVDECGIESDRSSTHRTIHLVMENDTSTGDVVLNWNKYQGFAYPTFYIERFTYDTLGWELIDSVGSDTTSYRDVGATALAGQNLLYAVGIDHPFGCQAWRGPRGATKNYNTVRSNRSVNVGSAQTYGDTTDTSSVVIPIMIEDTRLHLYPNPNDGKFNLKLLGTKQTEFDMAIFDVRGRIVFEGVVRFDSEGSTRDVEMLWPESGMYVIRLQTEEQAFYERFTIH